MITIKNDEEKEEKENEKITTFAHKHIIIGK